MKTIGLTAGGPGLLAQSDGVILNASVNQDNFAGTGKKVSLALKTSSANRHYQVSSTNPYYD